LVAENEGGKKPMVFENMLLRIIFGARRNEVIGE
jgi:hypothetical protein